MPERRVVVTLAAPGVEPVHADGTFMEFTPAQRLRRAVAVFALGVLLAASLIPIPIVHLLGIPLFLVGGVVLAIRQLSLAGRLRPLRMACPKCGERNRVGGGLGYRSLAPRERTCDSCRRGLTMTIEPREGAP